MGFFDIILPKRVYEKTINIRVAGLRREWQGLKLFLHLISNLVINFRELLN